MENSDQNALFDAFKTTMEMMEDRSYFVSKELKNLNRESFKEYVTKYNENGIVTVYTHRETDQKILLFFVKNVSQISTQDISNFTNKIKEAEVYRGIIISNKSLQNNADKLIKDINLNSEYYIEYFNINDLLVNIAKHDLVPKHIAVSEDEKKLVLKKYRVKESQLPKILTTDPMAKYLGLKKGNLVKIIRNSQTAGLYIVYRIVI